MDAEEFETIVRRVVREELHRFYATGNGLQQMDVEQAIRGLLGGELRRVPVTASPYAPTPQALGAAVKAEAARAGVRHHELAEVSGISPPTMWGRLKGAYEFKRAELDKIAERLGITTENIMESAQMAQAFGHPVEHTTAQASDDDWAQPARSRRRSPSPGSWD